MDIILLVIFGTVALLVLALGIIFFVILYQRRVIAHQMELKKINEQKELELIQASIHSEEQERMRIASELHDDVGATLASARLFLYKTKDAAYDDEVINQSKELLDESIGKIRNISHKLQPATLQHLGLEQSLQALIETINRSGAMNAQHLALSPLPRMADNVELAAYRVAQELIANIIKHSRATAICIEAGSADERVTILFSHDGTGLTQELYEEQIYKKGATGLKNIVNRLKSVNASIRFYKGDGYWFHTLVTIPLTADIKSP